MLTSSAILSVLWYTYIPVLATLVYPDLVNPTPQPQTQIHRNDNDKTECLRITHSQPYVCSQLWLQFLKTNLKSDNNLLSILITTVVSS